MSYPVLSPPTPPRCAQAARYSVCPFVRHNTAEETPVERPVSAMSTKGAAVTEMVPSVLTMISCVRMRPFDVLSQASRQDSRQYRPY